MFLKMSDEKQSTNEPTVVISTAEVSGGKPKSRLTKKHVLIAVTTLLVAGLVVAAVLVSVRMFTDNNLEVLKYTLQSKGVNQNVSTSENSVIFHVTSNTVDAWVVQDFDTGLQVSKVLSDGKTTCYVTALNRSVAVEPSAIPKTTPVVNDNSPSHSTVYKVIPEPIPDISFLGKKASSMCQNIPTYHAVPDCGKAYDSNIASSALNAASVDHRSKRTPAFCANIISGTIKYPCVCGCCVIACGNFTSANYVCSFYSGTWHCTYWMSYLYGYGSLAPSCKFNGTLYNP